MPDTALPALSLVASPGKRRAILDLAVQAEQRGFAGIACPSLGSAMSLCVSLAHVTHRIPFWTSIQPIYLALPAETAGTASHLQEVSDGRFRLGLGVSHARGARAPRRTGGSPAVGHEGLRDRRPRRRQGPDAPDLPRHHARPDAGARRRARAGRDLGQRGPQRGARPAHPGARRGRGRLLPRQHDPDGDRRRPRRGRRRQPADDERLRHPPELPELLARGRLRRGDGSRSKPRWRPASAIACRS